MKFATRMEIEQSFLDTFNPLLSEKTPHEILEWAVETFGKSLYQTTALGLTGMVTMDLLKGKVPVIFIDTLYHFPETYELLQKSHEKYGFELIVMKPKGFETREQFEAEFGKLYETDPTKYDYLVKAEPGHRAYTEHNVRAVLTGRRRSQGAERQSLNVLELDHQTSPPLLKINPLAFWDFNQVWTFIKEHDVPYNALVDQGYKSIGDIHSTVKSEGGERDGRWQGQEKSECGLHKDYFKLRMEALKKQRAQ
ncbi:phosphoadenosine phosphosulfate reductase [Gorgonomyces haynaldii]|nr:phosphoadenosine phosphosulfate reductase [Gorgonomyces haynaldii]